MPSPKRHPIPIGVYALVASVAIVFAFIGAFDRARTGMYLGTAALTLLLTFAAYLAVPMLERRDRRLAGTIALSAMTLIWGTLVFLVWNAHFAWIQTEAAEKVGVSLTFMTMTVLPVVHATLRLKRPRWRVSAWVQLIGFGAIGIFATASIWAEWPGEVVVTTIFATGCATILITMLQARSRMPWWVRHGMSLMAAAASLTWLRLFLGTYDPGSAFAWDPSIETLEFLTGCMLTGYALALVFGCLNLFLLAPVSNREWLRWTSFALVAVTVGLFTAFFFDVGAAVWSVGVRAGSSEALLLLRLGFASGIVSIALTLLYLSLLRLNITDEETGKAASLAITCPRCRRPAELQTGHQTCPHCELAFRISFDRPGCRRCGHGVDPDTSDRCTECGTPIFLSAS